MKGWCFYMVNMETISMQFHPRAFAAFGADLVTSDTVAVTELVKNCYDAFAYNVEVEFGEDDKGKYIQITDDGLGMTREIIRTSWAVIATPYKHYNPTVERDGAIRRVSGNKGLGRFSAARLGNTMIMWTKNAKDSYVRAKMDWQSFMDSSNVNDCRITLEVLPDNGVFNPTGTILRVRQLTSEWDKEKVDELRDSLSRLISPFKHVEKFSIKLTSSFYEAPIEIRTIDLIEKPLYKIWGNVDETGNIDWQYSFQPISKHLKERYKRDSVQWTESRMGFNANVVLSEGEETLTPYNAGAFTFEIRAWDLDSDSLEELTNTFDLKRRAIRNTISQYKGLSIYRDDVLVLPKSTASKDWLGIDLRRISSLGKRMSTSQIIGIINISSAGNPNIRDATDREKLVDTREYNQFSKVVETIILLLENLRLDDKSKGGGKLEKPTISSLMAPLSAHNLVIQIENAVERGEKNQDILEYVRQYGAENEKGLSTLQDRLTYYAQTASLGSVAIVILHEVLTGMTVIKRFLRHVFKKYSPLDEKVQEYYEDAERSHARLIDVAKSFAPLYRKDLHKLKNECDLKEVTQKSIRLIYSKKNSKGVIIENDIPDRITVKMFDGELQTIFVNLLDNACYWMQKNTQDKKIKISCIAFQNNESKWRLRISVSDNGPGISAESAQTIFEPGVTAKPNGIGMGLVIVAEILNFYNGKIATTIPGLLGGATFQFDIPMNKESER